MLGIGLQPAQMFWAFKSVEKNRKKNFLFEICKQDLSYIIAKSLFVIVGKNSVFFSKVCKADFYLKTEYFTAGIAFLMHTTFQIIEQYVTC